MSQAALQQIAELVKIAKEAIAEAEAVADRENVTFTFSLGYGMGGTYQPESIAEQYGDDAGWQSSSANC